MLARFNGNVVPFANDATSTNRTVFGGTTQSDNIDDNLNADFKKGWEIVGLNDSPTREDFNAMGYTLGALTSYLYQMGIAEYNALQEYKLNGLCLGTDGTIYQSLVDSNIGNDLTNGTKWKNVTSSFVDLVNNQSIDGIKTFVKSPIVPTPTTGTQAVNKDYVDNLKTIATGTATFDAVTNNINLTRIGTCVEIGDVIQISGAEDTKNNSEFTIEAIIDENNVIVNQAHANKGTSKNVASRSGDTGVTVKLLAKYYNAPLGLGQDWVNVLPIRNKDANYQNLTNRLIKASISAGNGVGFSLRCFVDGKFIGDTANVYTGITIPCIFDIPNKSIYKASTNVGTPNVTIWLELR